MEPPTSAPGGQPCEGPYKRAQGSGFALLAIAVFCLALAAGLSYRRCDARIARFFFDAKIPSNATWLLAIGEFGRPLTPIFLLLLWAWAEKRPRLLLAGLLAMLLAVCAVLPIKSAVGRIRPDENSSEVLKEPFYRRSYSFPSGDATSAFAVAIVAASSIPASARWIPFLLAAMASMTRLMLLRHFASDVIGGAALGILCGYAALQISRSAFARRTLSRAPPRCWRPALGVAALLYLIFDALKGGPLSKNFLPLFWPAVAFVLIAVKGPAWLRFHGAHNVRSPWTRVGAVFFCLCGVLFAAEPLKAIVSGDYTELLRSGPAAVLGLTGGYWAAKAMWGGDLARSAARMIAVAVLMVGMACLPKVAP
jgi:undecaprenyl-diphosphatase